MAENGMDHGSEKGYGQWHRRVFEGNAALFAVAATIAILIGGIVEIVPMFTPAGPEHSEAITPYTPLEVAGRDIYISEGCYLCHSQWVRPMRAEILRYGPWSRAWEYQYDRPFQLGSRRIGPDLHRIGNKYPDAWHYEHMRDPRSTTPGSSPVILLSSTIARPLTMTFSMPSTSARARRAFRRAAGPTAGPHGSPLPPRGRSRVPRADRRPRA